MDQMIPLHFCTLVLQFGTCCDVTFLTRQNPFLLVGHLAVLVVHHGAEVGQVEVRPFLCCNKSNAKDLDS